MRLVLRGEYYFNNYNIYYILFLKYCVRQKVPLFIKIVTRGRRERIILSRSRLLYYAKQKDPKLYKLLSELPEFKPCRYNIYSQRKTTLFEEQVYNFIIEKMKEYVNKRYEEMKLSKRVIEITASTYQKLLEIKQQERLPSLEAVIQRLIENYLCAKQTK